MNPRKLNMFHNRRHKGVRAIADSVRLTLKRMVEETVNQNRAVRRHADCRLHIRGKIHVIVHNLHTASAQYIGRTHHHRITNLMGNLQSLFHSNCHTGFRHGDFQLIHHSAEQVSIFRQIYHRRRRAKNLHTVFLQICRQIQRRLTAKLSNHTYRLLFFIDTQHIFQRQRLKIQLVRSIIVRRNCLWVTVDNNRLKSHLLQSKRSMHTTIIKLNTLSNTVRTSAQNHNLRLIGADRVAVRRIVSGIIISAVWRTAYMYALPGFLHA